MLNGMKDIQNKIDSFLKPFGLTSRMELDFGYYYRDDLVAYSFVITDKADRYFQKTLRDIHHFYTNLDSVDLFIMSILHEVGHSQTVDDISSLQWSRLNLTKFLIEKCYRLTRSNRIYERYFYCLDEVLATSWAVEYWNTHPATIFALKHSLAPLIKRFYELNEVFIVQKPIE